MEVETQRWLLGLVATSGETSEQVDEEIERTAVTRVLNLADVLPLAGAGAR
jgi:hypothetical protein